MDQNLEMTDAPQQFTPLTHQGSAITSGELENIQIDTFTQFPAQIPSVIEIEETPPNTAISTLSPPRIWLQVEEDKDGEMTDVTARATSGEEDTDGDMRDVPSVMSGLRDVNFLDGLGDDAMSDSSNDEDFKDSNSSDGTETEAGDWNLEDGEMTDLIADSLEEENQEMVDVSDLMDVADEEATPIFTRVMKAARKEYLISLGSREDSGWNKNKPLLTPFGKGTPAKRIRANIGELRGPPTRVHEPCECERKEILSDFCDCKIINGESSDTESVDTDSDNEEDEESEDKEKPKVYFLDSECDMDLQLNPTTSEYMKTWLEIRIKTGKWQKEYGVRKTRDDETLDDKINRRIVRNVRRLPSHMRWKLNLPYMRSPLAVEMNSSGDRFVMIPRCTGFRWDLDVFPGETVIRMVDEDAFSGE